MIPDHSKQCEEYFAANSHKYNFLTHQGCGTYTEDLVRECLQPLDPNWGLLEYHGNGTKYNGHRIDSILYRIPDEGDALLSSTDVIKDAETDHASSGWSRDEPRYTEAHWMKTPPSSTPTGMVPWVAYNEQGFNELKRTLAYDYARRPQGPDYDVSVWAARTFHNAFMGPNKVPMGMTDGMNKARAEWCAILQVAVVPVPPGWNIGDPV